MFEEVRRVLTKDGTFWLNSGDSYAGSGKGLTKFYQNKQRANVGSHDVVPIKDANFRPKNLIGIPWRLAFSLQDAGWNLRSDIIWQQAQPDANFLVKTVQQRRTNTYSCLVRVISILVRQLLAIAEQSTQYHPRKGVILDRRGKQAYNLAQMGNPSQDSSGGLGSGGDTRNCHDVWEIVAQPYKGAHFACFPEEIPRRCILAGCPKGGVVLDPFMGSGTSGVVALRYGRKFVGIELNPKYIKLAEKRLQCVEEFAEEESPKKSYVKIQSSLEDLFL